MKKFWIWYIPILTLVCLGLFIKLHQINESKPPLTINDPLDEYYEFYKTDTRTIYTKFNFIYYENEPLAKLIDKGKLSIDSIISKMELKDEFNDGGTLVYYSNDKNLSKTEFYIIKCNTLNGNKDIYITNQEENRCGA